MTAQSVAERFDAIIFDKDGTLLDFNASWDPALSHAIHEAAPEDQAKRETIAEVLGFDLTTQATMINAPFVHKPNSEIVALLAPLTDGRKLLDSCAARLLSTVTAVPAATEVLHALRAAGIRAAVATNDDEAAARAQLAALGWLTEPPLFAGIFGCDSGHGAKPQPGMLLAAAAAAGVEPSKCAMIGDAASDLQAARSAGFAAAILVGGRETVGQHAHLADFWVEELGGLLRPPTG